MSTVLVDVDGTLANIAHRVPILSDGQPHRWERFHSLIYLDTPTFVVQWVQELSWHYDVIVISARSSAFRRDTEEWLCAQNLLYSELLMREAGDTRDDVEIKREILMWLRAEHREIAFVIDDRPSVVEMWRAEGIRVFPVHQASWEATDDTRTD